MKTALAFLVILGLSLAVLIGCEPIPAPATSAQAQILNWGNGSTQTSAQLERTCDDRGVCCYRAYASSAPLSCVATRVEFVIKEDEDGHAKSNSRILPSQDQRGARVLGQSILGGPWETQ